MKAEVKNFRRELLRPGSCPHQTDRPRGLVVSHPALAIQGWQGFRPGLSVADFPMAVAIALDRAALGSPKGGWWGLGLLDLTFFHPVAEISPIVTP